MESEAWVTSMRRSTDIQSAIAKPQLNTLNTSSEVHVCGEYAATSLQEDGSVHATSGMLQISAAA